MRRGAGVGRADAMGFAVPGLDDLRFHLAASGVGDVHLRVDAPGDDGTASASAHDALSLIHI